MNEDHKVTVPRVGEGVHQVRIVRILRDTGDWVDEDTDLLEIETDKAILEVPSPVSGVIRSILCEEGEHKSVGDVLMEIGAREAAARGAQPRTFNQTRRRDRPATAEEKADEQAGSLPAEQRALIAHLQDSAEIVIPATLERAVDWEPISKARVAWRRSGECSAVPSSLEIVTCAVSQAMFTFEKFRARLSDLNEFSVSPQALIGIAKAEKGDVLVTPAVSINEGADLESVRDRVRPVIRKIRPQGGYHSLAISDMSAFEVVRAAPVVVYPAVATLFIGTPHWALDAKRRTIFASNFVLTFDHRIMNGAYAAAFLREVERNIRRIGREVERRCEQSVCGASSTEVLNVGS
ncbi:MAG: hypothetical protein EOM26_05525 [Alphaproteobacteria bacterium]|nr:hypothetical protein [Alphaproteobacteria bacterium]